MKKIILVLAVSLSMNSCAPEVIKIVQENKKVFKDKIEVGSYFLQIPYENKDPYTKGDTVKVISKHGKYIQYQHLKYSTYSKSYRKKSMEERFFRRAFTPMNNQK